MITVKGTYTTARIMTDQVEPSCMAQINTFVNHCAFTNPVAIMPDTHAGKGAVIGFTMALTDRVVPNVVGVDIGCGMLSSRLGKELPLSLEALDKKVRRRIPFGKDVHERAIVHLRDQFPWHDAQVRAEKFAHRFRQRFGKTLEIPAYSERWFLAKCEEIGGNTRRFINSLGTLGGGNHFIETGRSDSGEIWITVHSGSRNLGKRICEFWQSRAAKSFDRVRKERLREERVRARAVRRGGGEVQGESAQGDSGESCAMDFKGLEWLEGSAMHGYLCDMIFAQTYASVNRHTMLTVILETLGCEAAETIETVHNFIDFDDFIIRKGAIRAYAGERMIIPFNMRDGLLICEGKSNPEWNFSAPHGAGRIMSRTEAKKRLTVEDFARKMEGIYSSSVNFSTLDESPDAYKPAEEIERAIGPTAAIIDRVKPLHNMKDSKGGGGD